MSIEVRAAKLGVQGVAIILLVVLGLIGVGVAWWHWEDYKALKAANASLTSAANVTSAATDALSTASAEQQQVKITIDDNRATQDAIYEKLLRNDPGAKSWADDSIPQRVRDSDGSAIDRLEDNPAGRGIADKEN